MIPWMSTIMHGVETVTLLSGEYFFLQDSSLFFDALVPGFEKVFGRSSAYLVTSHPTASANKNDQSIITYALSYWLQLKNATTRAAMIMSNSDARATGSIRGWSGSIAEAPDDCTSSPYLNWALRYFAQRCERSDCVSSGIWDIMLVCPFWVSRGPVEAKVGTSMCKCSDRFNWLPITKPCCRSTNVNHWSTNAQ